MHEGNPGHSGATGQPSFFSQQIPKLGRAKELYDIGYAKCEKAIKEKEGSYQAASIKTQVGKHTTSRSSAPWAKKKKRTKSTRLTNTLNFTTTRSTLWTWKARRRITLSCTKRTMAALYLFRRDPQGVHQESHPQQGQSRH